MSKEKTTPQDHSQTPEKNTRGKIQCSMFTELLKANSPILFMLTQVKVPTVPA